MIVTCLSGDPIDFLSWLLNSLHIALGGTRKKGSSMYMYVSVLLPMLN